jgi:hypothetical protein
MKGPVENVGDLIESISGLARWAVAEYAPVVDAIVRTQCKDTRHIEHTLDGLLDFCFGPEALLLYKKLCRHYYFIDPSATAEYVQFYREMWDSEPEVQPWACC